jgi:hypothetical protein
MKRAKRGGGRALLVDVVVQIAVSARSGAAGASIYLALLLRAVAPARRTPAGWSLS